MQITLTRHRTYTFSRNGEALDSTTLHYRHDPARQVCGTIVESWNCYCNYNKILPVTIILMEKSKLIKITQTIALTSTPLSKHWTGNRHHYRWQCKRDQHHSCLHRCHTCGIQLSTGRSHPNFSRKPPMSANNSLTANIPLSYCEKSKFLRRWPFRIGNPEQNFPQRIVTRCTHLAYYSPTKRLLQYLPEGQQ